MSLFFGVWFIVGWLVVWVSIFLYSGIEWNKRGHDPKTGYDRVVSLIISGVMALAIALTFNAAYNLYKYLPNEENITAINGGQTKTIYSYEYNVLQTGTQNITPSILLDINKTEIKDVKNDSDKEGEEALKTNVYNNLTEGSKTFNEFASFFTSPIAIILGFLAILFIIKIETERLQNERRHNRKKAEDNLVDTAYYGIELLKDFDRRHIDFFIRQHELKNNFGLYIDASIIKNFPDLEQFVIETPDEKNSCTPNGFSSWFEKKFYFVKSKIGEIAKNPKLIFEWLASQQKPAQLKIYYSQKLIKKLYFMKSRIQDFKELEEKREILKRIYYSSIASIFSEHVKHKTTEGYSDIGDDVNKIQSLLEDIFLKTDFNMNAPENKSIVECFLRIEQGIRDFYDIKSGIYTKKDTSDVNNSNVNHSHPQEDDAPSDKNNLPGIKGKNPGEVNVLDKKLNENKQENDATSNKNNLPDINVNNPGEVNVLDMNLSENKPEKTNDISADIKKGNNPDEINTQKAALTNLNSNTDDHTKKSPIIDEHEIQLVLTNIFSDKYSKGICLISDLHETKKKGLEKYLKQYSLSECETRDFLDFYAALKQTHTEDKFEKLFTKMVADDKAAWRAEKFAAFKGFYEYIPSESKCEEMNSKDQAKRCIAILIRIWQECQAYYNYFDLFKNLHELKDTMDNRNRKSASRRHLTFLKKDKDIQDDEIFPLKITWFNDTNFCDYSELLKMYFEQQKSQSSDKMYEELFGESGTLQKDLQNNYTKFIDSLLGFIKSNYIEDKTFEAYASGLKNLCTEASHEEVFGKPKPKN